VFGATPTPTTATSAAPVVIESGDAGGQPQIHAVLAVDVAAYDTDLAAERSLQRRRKGLEERDVDPALARGRRDLRTDEPGTDDDHALRTRIEIAA
jgi:hypothetical protein